MNEIAPLPTRAQIDGLQQAMAKLPQAQLTTNHYFADGMYCRELIIPKGATIVGKVHKKEHFCMLIAGELTIVSDGRHQTIKAPAIFVSPPGVKRAGYAHEDSVFINVHRTSLTDLDAIECEMIEPDELSMFDSANKLLERPP